MDPFIQWLKMKFILNKKNSMDSITLDLEPTATVNELFLALYEHRGERYKRLSFNAYQKLISVYQCFLYGDHFKKKWLLDTYLADYHPKDPCYLTWEESPENQYFFIHNNFDPIGNSVLFWQTNLNSQGLGIEEDMSVQGCKRINFS